MQLYYNYPVDSEINMLKITSAVQVKKVSNHYYF